MTSVCARPIYWQTASSDRRPSYLRLPTPLVPNRSAGNAVTSRHRVCPRPVQFRQIGAKSGEHVTELAGQGAELETLGDALIGASRAGGVDAGRDAVAHTGVANLGDRFHQSRIITLQRHAESQAHRGGE